MTSSFITNVSTLSDLYTHVLLRLLVIFLRLFLKGLLQLKIIMPMHKWTYALNHLDWQFTEHIVIWTFAAEVKWKCELDTGTKSNYFESYIKCTCSLLPKTGRYLLVNNERKWAGVLGLLRMLCQGIKALYNLTDKQEERVRQENEADLKRFVSNICLEELAWKDGEKKDSEGALFVVRHLADWFHGPHCICYRDYMEEDMATWSPMVRGTSLERSHFSGLGESEVHRNKGVKWGGNAVVEPSRVVRQRATNLHRLLCLIC